MSDPGRAELLRRLSHDLRSPLGVLKGTLEQLASPESEADRARAAALAGRAIERLLRIADRLSLAGRAASGFTPIPQTVDLRASTEGALKRLLAAEPRSQVVVQIDGGGTWRTDGGLFSAALSELLGNALRNARGQVRVLLSDEAVAVEDDGAGVSPERAAALLEPSSAPSRHGLGLGLPLAADIARALGLELTVVPAGTRGALCRFVLRQPPAGAPR